ncbi:MAG: desulfoferrodoxin family protein [Eggerthellaceae bacterium]
MGKLQFFKCMHCGNVAVKLVDSKVPLVCCGEKMELLEPGTTDAATEKHVPVVTVNGNAVHVEVGSVLHPMEEEHLITMIVLETTKGFEVKQLSAGEAPKADFAVCPDEKPVAVYEYCNLHGLWKTEL